MGYVALRCDLASHNWSLKLAAANEKIHVWPLVLKHKQISQYSTLICLLVYQDMTCNSAIKTALFSNIKTAFSNEQINSARAEPTSLCEKKLRLGVFILWVFMKFYVVFLCRLFWGCWNHPISQHSQRMGATDTWQTLTWHSMKYWLVV